MAIEEEFNIVRIALCSAGDLRHQWEEGPRREATKRAKW